MTIESKDRAALRDLHALLHTLAEESIEALPDVHVEVLADLAARARLALAEPDPCAELFCCISNVMTDHQLDAKIPVLGGRTTRDVLIALAKVQS